MRTGALLNTSRAIILALGAAPAIIPPSPREGFMRYLTTLALTVGIISMGVSASPGQPIRGAQQRSGEPVGHGSGWSLESLAGLCSSVFERTRAPANSGFRYDFDRLIFEAAGASPDPTAAQNKTKVRALWRGAQESFRCNSNNFPVPDGNVLKLAASERSMLPLWRALDWGLELNYIDRSDGRTILDYILNALAEPDHSTDLLMVYEKYRAAGAKFSCEITRETSRLAFSSELDANSTSYWLQPLRDRIKACGR